MFKYSWNCLYKECIEDSDRIINILNCYNGKWMDKSEAKIILKISECVKDGFILDLQGLLNDPASNDDKVIYLMLAAKRNLADYYIHDSEVLNIELASVDVSKVERNKLITFDYKYIYFKY